MWLFWLILGIIIGTIFSALFRKWFGKAKNGVQEIATDAKAEIDKLKHGS